MNVMSCPTSHSYVNASHHAKLFHTEQDLYRLGTPRYNYEDEDADDNGNILNKSIPNINNEMYNQSSIGEDESTCILYNVQMLPSQQISDINDIIAHKIKQCAGRPLQTDSAMSITNWLKHMVNEFPTVATFDDWTNLIDQSTTKMTCTDAESCCSSRSVEEMIDAVVNDRAKSFSSFDDEARPPPQNITAILKHAVRTSLLCFGEKLTTPQTVFLLIDLFRVLEIALCGVLDRIDYLFNEIRVESSTETNGRNINKILQHDSSNHGKRHNTEEKELTGSNTSRSSDYEKLTLAEILLLRQILKSGISGRLSKEEVAMGGLMRLGNFKNAMTATLNIPSSYLTQKTVPVLGMSQPLFDPFKSARATTSFDKDQKKETYRSDTPLEIFTSRTLPNLEREKVQAEELTENPDMNGSMLLERSESTPHIEDDSKKSSKRLQTTQNEIECTINHENGIKSNQMFLTRPKLPDESLINADLAKVAIIASMTSGVSNAEEITSMDNQKHTSNLCMEPSFEASSEDLIKQPTVPLKSIPSSSISTSVLRLMGSDRDRIEGYVKAALASRSSSSSTNSTVDWSVFNQMLSNGQIASVGSIPPLTGISESLSNALNLQQLTDIGKVFGSCTGDRNQKQRDYQVRANGRSTTRPTECEECSSTSTKGSSYHDNSENIPNHSILSSVVQPLISKIARGSVADESGMPLVPPLENPHQNVLTSPPPIPGVITFNDGIPTTYDSSFLSIPSFAKASNNYRVRLQTQGGEAIELSSPVTSTLDSAKEKVSTLSSESAIDNTTSREKFTETSSQRLQVGEKHSGFLLKDVVEPLFRKRDSFDSEKETRPWDLNPMSGHISFSSITSIPAEEAEKERNADNSSGMIHLKTKFRLTRPRSTSDKKKKKNLKAKGERFESHSSDILPLSDERSFTGFETDGKGSDNYVVESNYRNVYEAGTIPVLQNQKISHQLRKQPNEEPLSCLSSSAFPEGVRLYQSVPQQAFPYSRFGEASRTLLSPMVEQIDKMADPASPSRVLDSKQVPSITERPSPIMDNRHLPQRTVEELERNTMVINPQQLDILRKLQEQEEMRRLAIEKSLDPVRELATVRTDGKRILPHSIIPGPPGLKQGYIDPEQILPQYSLSKYGVRTHGQTALHKLQPSYNSEKEYSTFSSEFPSTAAATAPFIGEIFSAIPPTHQLDFWEKPYPLSPSSLIPPKSLQLSSSKHKHQTQQPPLTVSRSASFKNSSSYATSTHYTASAKIKPSYDSPEVVNAHIQRILQCQPFALQQLQSSAETTKMTTLNALSTLQVKKITPTEKLMGNECKNIKNDAAERSNCFIEFRRDNAIAKAINLKPKSSTEVEVAAIESLEGRNREYGALMMIPSAAPQTHSLTSSTTKKQPLYWPHGFGSGNPTQVVRPAQLYFGNQTAESGKRLSTPPAPPPTLESAATDEEETTQGNPFMSPSSVDRIEQASNKKENDLNSQKVKQQAAAMCINKRVRANSTTNLLLDQQSTQPTETSSLGGMPLQPCSSTGQQLPSIEHSFILPDMQTFARMSVEEQQRIQSQIHHQQRNVHLARLHHQQPQQQYQQKVLQQMRSFPQQEPRLPMLPVQQVDEQLQRSLLSNYRSPMHGTSQVSVQAMNPSNSAPMSPSHSLPFASGPPRFRDSWGVPFYSGNQQTYQLTPLEIERQAQLQYQAQMQQYIQAQHYAKAHQLAQLQQTQKVAEQYHTFQHHQPYYFHDSFSPNVLPTSVAVHGKVTSLNNQLSIDPQMQNSTMVSHDLMVRRELSIPQLQQQALAPLHSYSSIEQQSQSQKYHNETLSHGTSSSSISENASTSSVLPLPEFDSPSPKLQVCNNPDRGRLFQYFYPAAVY